MLKRANISTLAKYVRQFHYLISRNSAHVVGSLSQGNSGGAKAGIFPSRLSIVAAKKPSRRLSSGSHPGSAAAVRKASICQPVDELTAFYENCIRGQRGGLLTGSWDLCSDSHWFVSRFSTTGRQGARVAGRNDLRGGFPPLGEWRSRDEVRRYPLVWLADTICFLKVLQLLHGRLVLLRSTRYGKFKNIRNISNPRAVAVNSMPCRDGFPLEARAVPSKGMGNGD